MFRLPGVGLIETFVGFNRQELKCSPKLVFPDAAKGAQSTQALAQAQKRARVHHFKGKSPLTHIPDAHTRTSQYLDFQLWHNDRCSSLPLLLRQRFLELPCTCNLDEHTHFDP